MVFFFKEKINLTKLNCAGLNFSFKILILDIFLISFGKKKFFEGVKRSHASTHVQFDQEQYMAQVRRGIFQEYSLLLKQVSCSLKSGIQVSRQTGSMWTT